MIDLEKIFKHILLIIFALIMIFFFLVAVNYFE
jgi:hypothetical protein